jgi:hypothetical protein
VRSRFTGHPTDDIAAIPSCSAGMCNFESNILFVRLTTWLKEEAHKEKADLQTFMIFQQSGSKGVLNVLDTNRSTEANIWYVSYRSNITPRRDDEERRPVRATRKFKAEVEARQFAQEIIGKGWSAIAGTLNPHTPKKTIASTQILDWIDGKV